MHLNGKLKGIECSKWQLTTEVSGAGPGGGGILNDCSYLIFGGYNVGSAGRMGERRMV